MHSRSTSSVATRSTVVLTDLSMGQMDGIALVRSLRKMNPAVRVIVSSGHMTKENIIILNGLGVQYVPRQALHRRQAPARAPRRAR